MKFLDITCKIENSIGRGQFGIYALPYAPPSSIWHSKDIYFHLTHTNTGHVGT